MNHPDLAVEFFRQGYNCSQAVLLAFSDITGLDEKTSLAISSSFGGGMGRMREVCGAVSGAFMVAGLLWGYYSPNEKEKKAEHYALIQKLAGKLKEQNGSIICRELLNLTDKSFSPIPEERTEQYYKRRPCAEYVRISAEIIDNEIELRNNKIEG